MSRATTQREMDDAVTAAVLHVASRFSCTPRDVAAACSSAPDGSGFVLSALARSHERNKETIA